MVNITQLANLVTKFVSENSTTILTITAVAGVVGTALVTFHEAPKAHKIIEQLKEDSKEPDKEIRHGKIFEDVKRLTWVTLPIVIAAGLSIVSVIGMNHIHSQRYAAVSAAYAIADQSLKEWKKHTEEVIGPKKTEEVRQSIASEHAKKVEENDMDLHIKHQMEENQLMYDPLDICIDSVTGSTFYTSASKLREAFAKLQNELNGCDFVSINDLYRYLEVRAVKVGENLGWNMGEEIDFRMTYSSTAADRPCIVLSYDPGPKNWKLGDEY